MSLIWRSYVDATILISPLWCAVSIFGLVFSGYPIWALYALVFSPAVVARAFTGRAILVGRWDGQFCFLTFGHVGRQP